MNDEAQDLLNNVDLFEVLEYDHPQFQHYVSFDDEIATEYDVTLDTLVDALLALPHVDSAVREDREVLLVGGSISASALELWLTDWWRTQLSGE
jgi:hypothetical protein